MEGSSQKNFFLKGEYEDILEFPEGEGVVSNEKTLHGRGMDMFVEQFIVHLISDPRTRRREEVTFYVDL